MKVEKFHKDFKLQGKSFSSKEELINFSKETIGIEVANFLQQWFNDSLFIEVKTSGSTGKPKVVKLQKTHMENSAKATGEYFKLPKTTTALLCMSPNYIAGKMMLVRALTLGWHLDIVKPVSKPLKNNKKKYEFSAMVPMQLHNSLNELYKINKLIVGGGVVSEELLNKIQNVDTAIFATYGMTETITHIAVKKLNNCHSEPVEESHYKTLPNISISIDKRGCLVIDAPKISSEKVITNDLVTLISEKEFKWLGRFDAIINSGGIKLIPEQIEINIGRILTTRFFVSGIPDVILGEKLILVVECANKEIAKEELLKKIKKLKLVSSYEIPKEVYFLNKFAVTETKKINRVETLKMIKNID
ncbi:AMP-binding protein [Lutibacter sp.]|uniref:AMP-binding protein n=1 Tax=Lutibacter sp. TaxID=1925666 RepID=UPI0025BA7D9C|nr:AMP-binding protein [Lutibacter sp.]MCF6168050.1 AMP-binding protein [Lutibacter sp.]